MLVPPSLLRRFICLQVTTNKVRIYLQELCTICFFSERCQRPVIPQNGWLIGVNFAHGGDVRIVCKFKNGTLDVRRSSKITCNHGVWSGPILSCEGKDSFVNVDSECVVLS